MASVALAAVTLAVVWRMRLGRPATPAPVTAVWRSLPGPLRRLLVSDICIRTCDAMVDAFLVLYAVNVVGISLPALGSLIGVQMATVILLAGAIGLVGVSSALP